MIESYVVTLFPVSFIAVLFGWGAALHRKAIEQDGVAPIARAPFYISKYCIVLIWVTMVLRSWGVDFLSLHGPGFLRWIALGVWVAGFALLFLGRFGLGDSFRIGSPKEKTRLKVDGLFRLSRNPMYVGVYATLLAAVLYTLNPFVLLVGIFVVVVHHRIVKAEEAHLEKVFGEEYAAYCRRVRRYL